ncbi:O-antigen polymerase [Salinicoccus roseus]|uniref:O-antigen polymerase n=1 Tax=Salinicoccus roseus TaxID=45670 RepID=UPI002300C3D3|nr:O-antigen polymerase [Salinicoccus roseus]
MSTFILTILFTFFVGGIILYAKKVDKDLFSPTIVALVLIFITNVPYLIVISFDYSFIDYLVRWRISQNDLPYYILFYLFILSIGIIGLLLGIKSNLSYYISSRIPVILSSFGKRNYISAFLLITIGVIAYVYFIYSVGGWNVWFENLYRRTSLIAGNNYLMSLLGLLNVGVYIYIASFKENKNLSKYVILFALIISVSLILTSLGGRKPTLQFIILCFLVWHFSVKKFRRIPLKAWLMIPLALLYILFIPSLRSEDGFRSMMMNPSEFFFNGIEEIMNVANHLSYIDHYLLILNHFTLEKLWWGKSYIDLIYAPLPSSIYPDKPPVDDGVYLRTIANGMDVTPSMPFRELFQSSWPPETVGIMYMNFWIPGVFLGMFILGLIYNISYQYMRKSDYTVFSIIMYGTIVLNFQLSNLRIVQTLTDIILIIIFVGLASYITKIFKKN